MSAVDPAALKMDVAMHLAWFEELISLGRETIPQRTAEAARRGLAQAAEALGLELIETKSAAPTFLLLPPGGTNPELTALLTWHAESQTVHPAAAESSERLALVAAIGALVSIASFAGGSRLGRPALVISPAATSGSLVLLEILESHRARLQAPVAFWPRIGPSSPGAKRRRVYLGARGRVVLGVWGESANPYAIRDRLVQDLRAEAFGPRPLDFELLRKLGENVAAQEFLEESLEEPTPDGEGEARIRSALFDPRGQVNRPSVRHPDRPQAWVMIEAAEAMDPDDVRRRARALAPDARVEMAEGFRWDRLNLYHRAVQAELQTAKSRSDGAEIWPMAPWVTPSGLFTRALGVPLAEWAVPLPSGASVRSPSQPAVETMEREFAELFLRGVGALGKESAEA